MKKVETIVAAIVVLINILAALLIYSIYTDLAFKMFHQVLG